MRWYAGSVAVMGTLLVGLGLALLVRGALEAKPIGLLLGALFVAVGAGRLYLLRRR
ncbi:MAG TPA: hypothetical protein VFI37_01780 [Gaiellaceae bacterium]|jgi:uncharacterized membrane protein|nr:hypothetical protein [Gaiellaceae bacterium]